MSRCPRERETLLAAARGWTGKDEEPLASHAAACPECLEVTAEVAAVRDECARDITSSHVPSSAIVWWRLERRLREDRARAARRALTVAHGVAGAIGAGAALGVAEAVTPVVRPALAATWSATMALAGAKPAWLSLPAAWSVPTVLMLLVVLVLVPTALYVGLGRGEQERERT